MSEIAKTLASGAALLTLGTIACVISPSLMGQVVKKANPDTLKLLHKG